jgi:hypothetical protein
MKAAFGQWVSLQLDELRRRVRAEREQEIEAEVTPEVLRAAAKGLKHAGPRLAAKAEAYRAAKPSADANWMIERESLQEIRASTGYSGPGRPPSGPDDTKPAAKAARDLWRIRHVILPRLWPEGAKAGWGLTNEELAKIAAARHPGTSAKAVLHWYENERLASL